MVRFGFISLPAAPSSKYLPERAEANLLKAAGRQSDEELSYFFRQSKSVTGWYGCPSGL
jgi:hypothetical protein